ncbi:MAG: hypothetical protein ABIL09_28160 [Gemmatimonadota bacterium]
MPHDTLLKGCELHVHLGGCYYLEDLLDLGRPVYREVDWGLFADSFERAFGRRPDAVALFEAALSGALPGLQALRDHYVFAPEDGGDFQRFMAKLNLLICLFRHWRARHGGAGPLVRRAVERHRREGLDYVEYRAMFGRGADDAESFLRFHAENAQAIRDAGGGGLEARYVVSVPRWEPLSGLHLVQRILDERPDLVDTIVGLDLCHFEEGYPPRRARALFRHLQVHNRRHPERALEVVYHVGEIFFDKSLESAVRWCHQAAELGARRLGHAIALGLDPEAAVARGLEAHVTESVAERLDQIAYDLEHAAALAAAGVPVEAQALEEERAALRRRRGRVRRPYTLERLSQVRRRQDFVLARLVELGTVIETCPTSNLRLGWVPRPEDHPLHRFLSSGVNLVIGADDPGIFDSPLATEVDWVARQTGHSPASLARRLGDPRRFRLGQRRHGRQEPQEIDTR